MNGKRITIYDLAKELGISASYVSRALNNHSSISKRVRDLVNQKAIELNYKHNSHAANLRRGSSKTIGVVVPKINESFFSEAIAGIEEACFENNHSLIICQSHELFKYESIAVETLIHHNVDCILISISAETRTSAHLEEVKNHNIHLIQFDRCRDDFDSYKVLNDNKEVSYTAVQKLIEQGYKKIAFLGGPEHLSIFHNRKEGYLQAVKEAGLSIAPGHIIDNAFSKEMAITAAKELLSSNNPPDAFFTVSDMQSLGVVQVAQSVNIMVPQELGIIGFANEAFTELVKPTLSSVNQRSKELGKCSANLYFQNLLKGDDASESSKLKIIKSDVIVRQSSSRSKILTS